MKRRKEKSENEVFAMTVLDGRRNQGMSKVMVLGGQKGSVRFE